MKSLRFSERVQAQIPIRFQNQIHQFVNNVSSSNNLKVKNEKEVENFIKVTREYFQFLSILLEIMKT